MRVLLLCSVAIMSSIAVPANAQTINDALNTIRVIADMETRKAENEKREQERREAIEDQRRKELEELEARVAQRQRVQQPVTTSQTATGAVTGRNRAFIGRNRNQVTTPDDYEPDSYLESDIHSRSWLSIEELRGEGRNISSNTGAVTDASGNTVTVVGTPSAPQAQNTPSVMAKDYWIKTPNANVYTENNTVIGMLSFNTPVTTYGESGGLGKISLTEDKWVQLSSLSTQMNSVNNMPAAHNVQLGLASDRANGSQGLGPKSPNTAPAGLRTIWVNTNSAGLYDGSGVAIGSLNYKNEMTAYEEKLGFVRIHPVNDMWVKANEVSNSEPTAKPYQTVKLEPKKADKPLYSRYVNANKLNVRDRPNGNAVGQKSFGSRVDVYAERNGWARISHNSVPPSWVSLTHLQSDVPKSQQKPQNAINTINRKVPMINCTTCKQGYTLLSFSKPKDGHVAVVIRARDFKGVYYEGRKFDCKGSTQYYNSNSNSKSRIWNNPDEVNKRTVHLSRTNAQANDIANFSCELAGY